MAVKAKGRTLFRIFGALLIFIGLIFSSIFRISLFKNIFAYSIVSFGFFPWLILIISLKLDLKFFINKLKIMSILLISYSLLLILCSFFLGLLTGILTSLEIFILLLILFCWDFSLSIYKKKKRLHILSGLIYFFINIVYLSFFDFLNYPVLISNFVFVVLGFLIIIIIEFNLRNKGLLTYI